MIGGRVPKRARSTIRSRCPDGRELVTLEDAGTYITKLPKAEHEAPEWQAAMQVVAACPVAAPPKAGHKTFVLWPFTTNAQSKWPIAHALGRTSGAASRLSEAWLAMPDRDITGLLCCAVDS